MIITEIIADFPNYSGIYDGFRHIIADYNVDLCQIRKLKKYVIR